MRADQLLAEFRRQVRLADADAELGNVRERDGLVRRSYPADPSAAGAMIEAPEGLGETEEEIEAAIDRQVAFFWGRGQRVEWKTYAEDAPPDLAERLRRKGFEIEDAEVVMLGECSHLVGEVGAPAGLRIREFSGAADWERVRLLMDEVWGTETSWVNDAMRAEQERDPALLRPVLAEEWAEGSGGGEGVPGRVVSYAALRLTPGVDFAGLWGGTTHPEWRGRGLYRALTAYRAGLALAAGHPFVRVDTSPDSRPILARLGLHPVTTTTPCVLSARPAD